MRIWISAASGLLLASCQGLGLYPPLLPVEEPVVEPLASLEHSLATLRADFNAHQDRPRVVTLLSSTCGTCELGAAMVKHTVLDAYPEADLAVYVIWVDVLARDTADSALRASGWLDDARVQHFHDPEARAGREFARGLLPVGVAWDIYLFYPAGAVWERDLPAPMGWSHQLGRVKAENFQPREALQAALTKSLLAVLAGGSTGLAQVAAPAE